jgi:hypothetical protein
MEPKGSLPCSEESATGSFHEPDESSPHLLTLFLQRPLPFHLLTDWLTDWLTKYMEKSPLEADSHPDSQIPVLLRNPKVHYHVHKFPPLVPILSQLHPVHIFRSYFLKIHSNIIFPVVSSL